MKYMLPKWQKSKEDLVREGVQQAYPRIWRYALSMTGARDRADDLVQTACLRAIERHHQFNKGTDVTKWLFRITHNLWISELRKENVRRGNGLVGIDAIDIQDPAQDIEIHIQQKELVDAVLQLPEAQRQTAILVYAEGFSYKDAAHILDIPVGTIMSRLAAARRTLTEQLRGGGVERYAG